MEPVFYERFREVVGLASPGVENYEDPEFWPEARAALARIFLQRALPEWLEAFDGTDACVEAVIGLDAAPAHPQIAARGSLADVLGVRQPAPAPRLSRSVARIAGPPPEADSDPQRILAEWKAR